MIGKTLTPYIFRMNGIFVLLIQIQQDLENIADPIINAQKEVKITTGVIMKTEVSIFSSSLSKFQNLPYFWFALSSVTVSVGNIYTLNQ